MDQARLRLEQTILEKNFPRRYAFVDMDTSRPNLVIGMRTNSARTYRLNLMIPSDYPHSKPTVYVVYPQELRDRDGRLLSEIGTSHALHLLGPRGNDIQLCHYKSENWHPNVTLYKVALKCLIWLNAYEAYLETGTPLSTYLGD